MIFMFLSSIIRFFSGAAKRGERKRTRKIDGFPKKFGTDGLEREEIVLPPEREDASLSPPLFSYGEERHRGQDAQPVRKEIRSRLKPAPVLSGKEEKEYKVISEEQAFVTENIFHGKNLPLAIISAEVFSPPRSKRRFRSNS